nr:hypothetical protein [Candidatus Paceibacterota bacterium]
MSRFITTLFAIALLFNTLPVFAQEPPATEADEAAIIDTPPVPSLPAQAATGPLSCFDYYT